MKKNIQKVVISLAVVAMLGFSTNAFADWGKGYGRHGWGPPQQGQGWSRGGYGGYGPGCDWSNVSEEDRKKMDQERRAFWEATQNVRRNLHSKRLELRSELVKANPDAQKAVAMQKEISNLRSELAQKRIEHILAMKKINPDAGQGFSGKGSRGYGPGYGQGRCWK